jgi:hypothetical protein
VNAAEFAKLKTRMEASSMKRKIFALSGPSVRQRHNDAATMWRTARAGAVTAVTDTCDHLFVSIVAEDVFCR